MFLTIKRSNISDCLTPLIMPSGCPCRGTALPCPDGCRKAMSEAPKSHFLKGGLSACKRYPFGLAKDHLLRAKRRPFGKPRKQPFATAAVCRRRMRPRFRQKYLTAKKKKQHKPRQHLPAATKRNTAGRKRRKHGRKSPAARKGAETAEKRRRRKNHAATQPKNEAAATPCRTHIIYIAHNAPKTANKR